MNGGTERKTTTIVRVWLALLTGLTAASALAGALALATGIADLGPVVVSRLPWHSVVFAGVALAVVVAVPMFVAAYLAAHDGGGYRSAAMVAGLLLIGWLVVEFTMIRDFSWLQVVFAAVGVVVLLLARPATSRRGPVVRSGR